MMMEQLKFLSTIKSFSRREEGGVMVFVAILIIPLLLFVGLAVDLGRAYYVQSVISGAIDNAVMSGAIKNGSDQDIIDEAKDFYRASIPQNFMATTPDPVITVTGTDVKVVKGDAEATLPTVFMQIMGDYDMTVTATAQVSLGNQTRPVEVVLVLDNTGSMAGSKISSLKTAAKNLVDILFGKQGLQDNLFIGVVPYSTTVNIAGTPGNPAGRTTPSWVTTEGHSTIGNDEFFPSNALWAGCVEARAKKGTANVVDLNDTPPLNNSVKFNPFFYPSTRIHGYPFDASKFNPPGNSGSFPVDPPWTDYSKCKKGKDDSDYSKSSYSSSSYDDDDDDKDHGKGGKDDDDCNDDDDGKGGGKDDSCKTFEKGDNDWGLTMAGNSGRFSPNPTGFSIHSGSQFNQRFRNNVDVGPNLGCPIPMLPMTSSKTTVLAKINQQMATYRGGTMGHTGLVWGWRLISPRWSGLLPNAGSKVLPLPYDESKKIIVMMTDGDNTWFDWPDGLPGAPKSSTYPDADYGGYGRRSENRINASNPNNAGVVKTRLNDMMTQVCNNIKNAASGDDRVDIYTITFGNVSADTRTLYQNCATDPSFYYNAPTNSELIQAFQDIGNRINVLRYSWPGSP